MGLFKSLMSVISTDGKTGTPFVFDKNHTVYFKGNGVTKEDAARVAGFFKGYGYFTDSSQSDVQLFAKDSNGPVNIGFVIGGKSVSPETATFFKASSEGLQELFGGRTIVLVLLDSNLQQLQAL